MITRENFFEIQNPDTHFCQVWSYLVSHSKLLVRVHKENFHDESFYLHFEMVQYFEGPLSWTGANFYIGNPDECIKLLQQRGLKGVSDDYLLEHFHLYVVDLPNFEAAKILAASHATQSSFIHLDFSWLIGPDSN